MADHASPEDGHTHGGKKVSTHMLVHAHTYRSGHGNSNDKQNIDLDSLSNMNEAWRC